MDAKQQVVHFVEALLTDPGPWLAIEFWPDNHDATRSEWVRSAPEDWLNIILDIIANPDMYGFGNPTYNRWNIELAGLLADSAQERYTMLL
jgi:hypothetical protein